VAAVAYILVTIGWREDILAAIPAALASGLMGAMHLGAGTGEFGVPRLRKPMAGMAAAIAVYAGSKAPLLMWKLYARPNSAELSAGFHVYLVVVGILLFGLGVPMLWYLWENKRGRPEAGA
jgi:hypothetical protein